MKQFSFHGLLSAICGFTMLASAPGAQSKVAIGSFLFNRLFFNYFTLLFAVTAFLGGGVAQGQATQYWRTDGTTGGTWPTSAFWSSAPSSTGGSVWVSGSNAIFNENSTLTFATTSVGNVIVADGKSVTVTSGGTASGTTVRTMNIGTGSSLIWTGQGLSTSPGFGIIKNGTGSWDMGSQGNPFNATNGGFTLNAGTVVSGGNNNFGGATSLLTINGGTIQSSGARAYANPITVGGDFTLTGTGTATHSGAVALGASGRTVTNSTTSGSRAFSGVISGGAGVGNTALTFSGAGAGTIDITNTANTFTGNINVTGAEVSFAADGSLGTVPGTLTANSIVIDGGRLTLIPPATTSFTLNANRGIQVGATAGTAVSVKTGTSVTYNGVIADKSGSTGIFSKQGGAILSLGGVSTYSGATSINNGTVQLTTGSDRLPVGTTVSLGQAGNTNLGTFDLNGQNQRIAGLATTPGSAITGNNIVTSATSAILTISGTGSNTFGSTLAANPGIITGAVSIVKGRYRYANVWG